MGRGRKKKMKQSNSSNNQYEFYNIEQQKLDEKELQKSIDAGMVNWEKFRNIMFRDLCLNTEILSDNKIGFYDLTRVADAIRNPAYDWPILMNVSEYLMQVSPYYMRLNNYFGNMALFDWTLDLYDIKDSAKKSTIKQSYTKLASKLETMNLKHEFSKIMKVLPYQDIYCGLLFDKDGSFFIQKINYRICKLYRIQDGLYNFAINLSKIKATELNAYPDYVQEAYLEYVDSGQTVACAWYLPPADKQICIKLNWQWTYPYPMLIGMLQDLLDLDVYKKLKLQSARNDNYKAILIEVPIDKDSVDKPLLTPQTIAMFANLNKQNMSKDIGLLHTLGSKGEAISFKDSSNTRNIVSDAVDEIYNASGVTKEMFNGSSTATAVTYSLENDSGIVYSIYRQLERWVNRFIKLNKYNKTNYKFAITILDSTIFNRDTVTTRYKDLAALGITCVDKLFASIGMTPSKVLGSYVVHNDIFDYHNNLVPLSSAYNSSSSDKGGRPTNESKGELLSEEGERTSDNDSNIR
jgi:hypothetical protein